MKSLKPLMLMKDPVTGFGLYGGHDWSPLQIKKFELLKVHLTRDEWEKFCQNIHPDHTAIALEEDVLSDVICGAFNWERTEEGGGFWDDIYYRLEEDEWNEVEEYD